MAVISSSYIHLMTLEGFYPNQEVDIGFAGYYTKEESRVTSYIVNDDEDNFVLTNGSTASAANVAWGSFTADENGLIVIKAKKLSGYRGHFNGLHVIPK